MRKTCSNRIKIALLGFTLSGVLFGCAESEFQNAQGTPPKDNKPETLDETPTIKSDLAEENDPDNKSADPDAENSGDLFDTPDGGQDRSSENSSSESGDTGLTIDIEDFDGPGSENIRELIVSEDLRECERFKPGLTGKLYQLPAGQRNLPNFDTINPVGEVSAQTLNVPSRRFTEGFPGVPDLIEWFAIVFDAFIEVPEDGDYRFRTTSDDGSKVYVNDQLVVNNDGTHAPRTIDSTTVTLSQGHVPIKVEWFQGPRNHIALQLFWQKPGGGFEIIPADVLVSQGDCDLDDVGTFD